MHVESILSEKGRSVETIPQECTVLEAVRRLVGNRIGSLVVLRGDQIAGIITERDVLRLTDRNPTSLGTTRVEKVMNRDVIIAEPDDDVHYIMDVMTQNRIRHLPVVRDGNLQGLISIGDVVNALRCDAEAENHYLRDYVQGMVR